MLRGNNHNVALLFALVIFSVVSCHSIGADVITASSKGLQINRQNSPRSNEVGIGEKLLQVRHLLKSLFFDWNFGESEGKVKCNKIIISFRSRYQNKYLNGLRSVAQHRPVMITIGRGP